MDIETTEAYKLQEIFADEAAELEFSILQKQQSKLPWTKEEQPCHDLNPGIVSVLETLYSVGSEAMNQAADYDQQRVVDEHLDCWKNTSE